MEEVWVTYREDLDEVEAQIRKNLDSEIPLINEIAAHILSSGGKRIRPLLLVLCSRLSGYVRQEDFMLGSLIEFIHTATLLHDDVLDEAELRRGQETARRLWGNHASILVGDYLYSRAMCQISAFHNHGVNEVLSEACKKMAEGEILQLCATAQPTVTESDYLRVIEYKTGALVAASCKVGAIVGGATENQQAALYRFGMKMGMAFQLADDHLDYTADGERLGKTLGQDFRQGMITLPLIHLLQACPYEERTEILRQIESHELDEPALFRLIGLMEQYGSLAYTATRAQEYIDAAIQELDSYEDSPAKRALTTVADYMVNRDQ
jgi:octaprenyl-diphosphate synthase